MTKNVHNLPQVYFGPVTGKPLNWRKAKSLKIDLDDDAELAKTPSDVLRMLGFDPLDIKKIKDTE